MLRAAFATRWKAHGSTSRAIWHSGYLPPEDDEFPTFDERQVPARQPGPRDRRHTDTWSNHLAPLPRRHATKRGRIIGRQPVSHGLPETRSVAEPQAATLATGRLQGWCQRSGRFSVSACSWHAISANRRPRTATSLTLETLLRPLESATCWQAGFRARCRCRWSRNESPERGGATGSGGQMPTLV